MRRPVTDLELHAAPRVIVLGNAGSGKTTLAGAFAAEAGVPHLDLDTVAWAPEPAHGPSPQPSLQPSPERRETAASVADVDAFTIRPSGWVVEGCYGDLLRAAARRADRVVFLDPGVEVCVANCRRRPFEPHKFATRAAQDAHLARLEEWVRTYERRDDEFSRAAHVALFASHGGPRLHVRTQDDRALEWLRLRFGPARPDEFPVLDDLYARARRAHHPWVDPATIAPGDLADDSAGETLEVARRGGRPVAFISLWEPERFVHHLYVDPELAGQRIGAALLAYAAARRPGALRLKCVERNEGARRFYEREGFRVVERGVGTEGPYLLMCRDG